MPRAKNISDAAIARTNMLMRRQFGSLNATLEKLKQRRIEMTAAIDAQILGIERHLRKFNEFLSGSATVGKAKSGHVGGGKRGSGKRAGPGPAILQAIQKHPKGISSADIISGLNAAGDKKRIASIRNALNYLKRSKQVRQDKAGKYHAA